MDDLVQFLRSQLDEDERIARAASDNATTGDQWDAKLYGDDPESQDAWGQLPFEEDPTPWVCVRHAARHDPARVLREIDAKRAILALHTQSLRDGGCQVCDVPGGRRLRPDACTTVRMLAVVYADRPGYRDDWRP